MTGPTGTTGATGAAGISALSAGTTLASSGTVSFSNANGISFGLAGQTLTASVSAATLSLYQYPPGDFATSLIGAAGNATMRFMPVQVEQFVSATQAKMLASITMQTSSNNTMRGTITIAMGFYTMNASTLSLASSGSQSYSWSHTSNESTASYPGAKELTVSLAANITPGNWWFGSYFRSSNGGTSEGSLGITGLGAILQTTWSGPWGAATNSTNRLMDGLGPYSASTAAIMASAAISDIDYSAQIRMPWFALRATS